MAKSNHPALLCFSPSLSGQFDPGATRPIQTALSPQTLLKCILEESRSSSSPSPFHSADFNTTRVLQLQQKAKGRDLFTPASAPRISTSFGPESVPSWARTSTSTHPIGAGSPLLREIPTTNLHPMLINGVRCTSPVIPEELSLYHESPTYLMYENENEYECSPVRATEGGTSLGGVDVGMTNRRSARPRAGTHSPPALRLALGRADSEGAILTRVTATKHTSPTKLKGKEGEIGLSGGRHEDDQDGTIQPQAKLRKRASYNVLSTLSKLNAGSRASSTVSDAHGTLRSVWEKDATRRMLAPGRTPGVALGVDCSEDEGSLGLFVERARMHERGRGGLNLRPKVTRNVTSPLPRAIPRQSATQMKSLSNGHQFEVAGRSISPAKLDRCLMPHDEGDSYIKGIRALVQDRDPESLQGERREENEDINPGLALSPSSSTSSGFSTLLASPTGPATETAGSGPLFNADGSGTPGHDGQSGVGTEGIPTSPRVLVDFEKLTVQLRDHQGRICFDALGLGENDPDPDPKLNHPQEDRQYGKNHHGNGNQVERGDCTRTEHKPSTSGAESKERDTAIQHSSPTRGRAGLRMTSARKFFGRGRSQSQAQIQSMTNKGSRDMPDLAAMTGDESRMRMLGQGGDRAQPLAYHTNTGANPSKDDKDSTQQAANPRIVKLKSQEEREDEAAAMEEMKLIWGAGGGGRRGGRRMLKRRVTVF